MSKEVKIQLYKENGKGVIGFLDLATDSNLGLTKSIADISQPEKRKATGSKTITLVGNENNNNLLSHLYDVNAIDLTFDRNIKQPCCILVDGEILMDNAFLQITEINKEQKNSGEEERLTYSAVVKSSVSLFFDKIKEGNLQDIKISNFDIPNNGNILMSPTLVKNSFDNDYTDGYKFVLKAVNQSSVSWADVTPAFYLFNLFRALIRNNGYTFDFPEIGVEDSEVVNSTDDLHFRKLLIPFTGEIPEDSVTQKDKYFLRTYNDAPFDLKPTNSNGIITDGSRINPSTEVDITPQNYNSYNLFYQGGYKSPFTGILKIKINNKASSFNVFNPNVGNAVFYGGNLTYKIGTVVYVNGLEYMKIPMNGNYHINTGTFFTAGNTAIYSNIDEDIYYNIPVNIGDEVKVYNYFHCVEAPSNYGFFLANSDFSILHNVVLSFKNVWTKVDFTANVSNTLIYGNELDFNLFLPKIKQLDFFKGVIGLFNLYIDYSDDNPNRLIFMTRDKYYKSGKGHDITHLLAKDQSQKITFLSDEVKKRQIFTYKNGKSENLKKYTESTGATFGQASFNLNSEFNQGEDKLEIPFLPALTISKEGFYYSDILEKDGIYILYDGGNENRNLNIMGIGSLASVTSSKYPLTLHNDNPLAPTYDLNFGQLDRLTFSEAGTTTNNQYNLRYRNYAHQLDTGKKLTAVFYLTPENFNKFKLNDRYYIRNAWYYIDEITDFNPTKNNLVQISFFTASEDLSIPSKIVIPPTTFDPVILNPDFGGGNVVFEPSTGVIIRNPKIPVIGIGNVVIDGTIVKGNFNKGGGIIIGNNVTNINGIYTSTPDNFTVEILERLKDLEDKINNEIQLPTLVKIHNFGVLQGEVIVPYGSTYSINEI
jgi:hypothetical protein